MREDGESVPIQTRFSARLAICAKVRKERVGSVTVREERRRCRERVRGVSMGGGERENSAQPGNAEPVGIRSRSLRRLALLNSPSSHLSHQYAQLHTSQGQHNTQCMTTLQPPPVPSPSSSTDRPSLAPRSSSYRSPALPSVGLSNLTTRSSSTSRAYDPDQQLPTPNSPYRAAVPPGAFNVGGAAYRAWRRDSKEHSLLLARRRSSAGVERVEKENRTAAPRERKASKGKGKAVAFVVGLPSSGEEGDVEPDEGPEAGEAREDGLEGVFNLFDKRWEGAIPREPNVDDMIRCQVRASLY